MAGVLVLDRTFRAVDYISPERAITLCLLGKATAVVEYEDRVFRSEHLTIHVPKVISLKVYVPLNKQVTDNVIKSLLFARDGYTCQYCNKHKSELPKGVYLTKDHVVPISRFSGATRAERLRKADTWENSTTACLKCNNEKDNKTPEEAGLKLLSKPKRPQGVMITILTKVDEEQKQFIQTY